MWLASFRGREVIYPGPFGSITAGADKNYPLDYSHLNIQGYACGAKGLPKGVDARPRHRDLPVGEHRDRVRLDQEGEDEGADLHRRARLHRDRAQELGALRDRHGDLRDHAGLRRERLRHRPAAGARQGRQGQELAGDGPPDRDLQALPRGLRRDPRADERRGHALRRGRVRAEQARAGHDRAEVGAGRQVHRRRDPRRRPGARAGAQAPRLHRDPRPDAAGRRSRRSRRARSRSSSGTRGSASSTTRASSRKWRGCARSASSASR